jgi:hypothetical protein
MTTKLTEITTQYHTFVDNQVLTKDQLNGFISYFEDQDRLTRVFLHGVGIVCGFKLIFDKAGPSLTITQGVGVTTDGDLISLQSNVPLSRNKSIVLDDIKYTHVRKFEDKFADYKFFKRTQIISGRVSLAPMTLWELLPSEEENSIPLAKLAAADKMVVVLYLESYPKPADLCTAIDCDSQGIEQVARLRILLVSKDDAATIAQNDSIYSKYNVVEEYLGLPDLSVSRVVLNQLNTSGYDSLKRAYHTAINSHDLLNLLESGITKLLTGFEPLLKLNLHKRTVTLLKLQYRRIVGFSFSSVPSDFQYRYDFVKDLVDTYQEVRALLLFLAAECFPDIGAFPKHLMLGSIDEIGSDDLKYRHRFYKSPAISCGHDKFEQCRNLLFRMMQMINSYSAKPGVVKITPSQKLPALSNRAIPFYYTVDQTLLKNWDFQKTIKYAAGTNLSYHRGNLAQLQQIQEPLNFNTDRFDFYRIEGHQGKNWKTALDEIVSLKQKFGLAFDVKALSVNINRESLNLDEYECEFEDLNVLLKAWTAEQECILAEVSSLFSGFSLKEPGINIKTPVAVADIIRDRDVTLSLANNLKVDSLFVKANDFQIKEAALVQPVISKSSTIIQDNLTISEDALGAVMVNALKSSEGKSVNDIIANAKELLSPVLVGEVWQSQPDLRKLVIDDSVEILAWSNELLQRMPNILRDFTDVKVETYNLTLKQLCARVQRMKTSYQTSRLTENVKAIMALLINQLATVCCSGKKLEVLFAEINKRKESIIVGLQLSKFAEQHPGLEHKAGVEPGGTFVLVYLNRVKISDAVGNLSSLNRISTLLNQPVATSAKVSSLRIGELEDLLIVAKKDKIPEVELLSIEKLILDERINLAGRVVATIDVPNNTVVADFSLPYMCCSGCAPVNFIIQKPPVRLLFDRDMVCLDSETEPVKYEVSPADGEIKADFDIPGMTIGFGQIAFDPALFPDEMFGRIIRFMVNQQVTEAKLTVHKAINVDFSILESPGATNLFSFVPSGDIEGASFHWDFGDGSEPSTQQNPVHRYKVPVNDENKVSVTLTVTALNGTCKATASHEIVFKEIEIRINIVPLDFCANSRQSHLFTVSPDVVDAVIGGPGVSPLRTGGFVFVPALAGEGQHTFTVNGKPSGLSVTVHQPPVARFSPQQTGNQLIITNQSTGATKFVWEINGQKIESADLSPLKFDLNAESPTSWTIMLTAFSEHCGVNTTPVEKFEVTINDNDLKNCLNDTRVLVQRDLRTLQRLNLVGSNVVVPIWEATSKLYGGTDKFSEGVLDDFDNFLTGTHNARLSEMFVDLINHTSNIIIELSRNRQSPEFINLVNLLAHQLRLFYNILACQNKDDILKAESEILKMLETIVAVLSALKDARVELPNAMRTFFKQWSARIVGIEILDKHVGIISDSNLI